MLLWSLQLGTFFALSLLLFEGKAASQSVKEFGGVRESTTITTKDSAVGRQNWKFVVFADEDDHDHDHDHDHDQDDDDHDHDHGSEDGDEHDHDHDHGDGDSSEWEYAAIVMLNAGEDYTWVAARKNGSYAAARMDLLFIPAEDATQEALQTAEVSAKKIWTVNTTATVVKATSNATVVENRVHRLKFDQTKVISLFNIRVGSAVSRATSSAPYAVFTQHDPEEFTGVEGMPYLLAASGDAVGAVVTKSTTSERKASIGEAIGASFCVALASFIGVVFLVPGFGFLAKQYNFLHGIDAFASGAIISLIVCIMIPEAITNISSQYSNESQSSAWFGSFVLGGFFCPLLLDWVIGLIFPGGHNHGTVDGAIKEIGMEDEAPGVANITYHPRSGTVTGEELFNPEDPPDYFVPHHAPTPDSLTPPNVNDAEEGAEKCDVATPPARKSWGRQLFGCCPVNGVVWSITVGDGLHNFTDGVLIGVAFKFCGSSLGWAIAGASTVHELAAELSEFWLLISPTAGGLSFLQAVLLNFLSSLTVVVGCLMVSYLDITAFTLGLLLSAGAGLLLYIGTVSVWSRVLGSSEPNALFVLVMSFCFIFGAVAIGLVLLSHQHCEVGGSGHGHSHGH